MAKVLSVSFGQKKLRLKLQLELPLLTTKIPVMGAGRSCNLKMHLVCQFNSCKTISLAISKWEWLLV